MRALITGIGGFVGGHLARHLAQQGDSVTGIGRQAGRSDLPPGVQLVEADLRDTGAVAAIMAEVRPEAVYHLAAQSSTGDSFSDPWATLSNNLQAQMVLLEATLACQPRPTVLVVGSSDEYGNVHRDELPTNEDAPLRPSTPYALSKAAQDLQGYQYAAQHGLPVVRVRPFSHTGPGHDARFVVPSFARQLAEIEAGLRPPELHVGNLEAERDFTDVRDMVRAYRLAVTQGEPGAVYNLGSGVARRLADVLQQLIALSATSVEVHVDPARLRPVDLPYQLADARRFHARTGWQPTIAWHITLRDTLDHWRARVAESRQAVEPV